MDYPNTPWPFGLLGTWPSPHPPSPPPLLHLLPPLFFLISLKDCPPLQCHFQSRGRCYSHRKAAAGGKVTEEERRRGEEEKRRRGGEEERRGTHRAGVLRLVHVVPAVGLGSLGQRPGGKGVIVEKL